MATGVDRLSFDRSKLQRAAILASAVLQVLVTFLPSLGIGEPIGERSDAVRTIITPAGWAFSIWGPLFAGALSYAIYQIAPAQRRSNLLHKIGWPSAGAFLGNALWALYTQFLNLNAGSALIIIFTLVCLLICFAAIVRTGSPLTRGEQFFVALPLSALAAWLTVATIVNIAVSLKFHGVILGEPAFIATAIVAVGGIIAASAVWRGRGNPWYALVFVWAMAGIYGATRMENGLVAIASIASAIIVLAVAAATLGRNDNWRKWVGSHPV